MTSESAYTISASRSASKQRIYNAAAELFMEKGFSATSMRDIASSVGLLPSSLYSHIRSKQELLRDICFECGTKFLEGIDAIQTKNDRSEEKVINLIRLHVTVAREDVTSMTVFNDEWRHLEEPLLGEFRQMRKTYEGKCLDILRGGVSKGDFRAVNEYVALNVILNSTIWVRKSKQLQSLDPDALTADIGDVILNGLSNKTHDPIQ